MHLGNCKVGATVAYVMHVFQSGNHDIPQIHVVLGESQQAKHGFEK